MKQVLCGIAMASAAFCFSPAAVHAAGHDHAAAAPVALADGTVKKIDQAGGMLTLSHGPLENLGMPAMTMAFRVKAPGAVERLKVGDKVRFLADYIGGEVVIVRLEPAK